MCLPQYLKGCTIPDAQAAAHIFGLGLQMSILVMYAEPFWYRQPRRLCLHMYVRKDKKGKERTGKEGKNPADVSRGNKKEMLAGADLIKKKNTRKEEEGRKYEKSGYQM